MADEEEALEEMVTRTTVRNSTDNPLKFRLEPWGEEYKMVPDARFVLRTTGPPDGELEIDLGTDHVTVWAWQGSSVTIVQDGVGELGRGSSERGRVPRTPVDRQMEP